MSKIYYIEEKDGFVPALMIGYYDRVDENNVPAITESKIATSSSSKEFLQDLARVLNNSVRFNYDFGKPSDE